MNTLLISIFILCVFIYFHNSSPKPTLLKQNYGIVSFNDKVQKNDSILDNVETKPLPLFSFSESTNKLPYSILSLSVTEFLSKLNKATKDNFELLKVFTIQHGSFLEFTTIQLTLQVYTRGHNYNMILKTILYIDDNDNVNIHSVDMVTPLPYDDKWENQNNNFEKINFNQSSQIKGFSEKEYTSFNK